MLNCPIRNIEISWVPKNKVKKYYYPKERLLEIKKSGSRDILEEKLICLSELLEDEAKIYGSLGVTGSILTKTHNPKFSDIDLTIYGLKNSYKLKNALLNMKKKSEWIKAVNASEKEQWITNRLEKHNISRNELEKIFEKRWNYGYFQGVYFSIHPTRSDEEITENYGENIYNRVGEVKGKAKVIDSTESIFLPAIYKVAECEPIEKVSEIVSFEGLYCSLFEPGNTIGFKGILEEVKGKESHQRIIVGGAGSHDSYLKWLY
jgi:predicted nucleotidyltransferase